ncbi:MAG: hypothetical protein Q8N56_01305 [bacterium]|nr:hypothetical protein [bacterium]
MKQKIDTDPKMKYGHRQAKRDIRFIFSKQGLIFTEKEERAK